MEQTFECIFQNWENYFLCNAVKTWAVTISRICYLIPNCVSLSCLAAANRYFTFQIFMVFTDASQSVLGKIAWVLVRNLLVLIQQHVSLPGLNDPCLTAALTFCTFQPTSIWSQWHLYLYPKLRFLTWKSVLCQMLLHVWWDHSLSQAFQRAAAVDGSITVSLLPAGDPLSSCAFSNRCASPSCMPSFS